MSLKNGTSALLNDFPVKYDLENGFHFLKHSSNVFAHYIGNSCNTSVQILYGVPTFYNDWLNDQCRISQVDEAEDSDSAS